MTDSNRRQSPPSAREGRPGAAGRRMPTRLTLSGKPIYDEKPNRKGKPAAGAKPGAPGARAGASVAKAGAPGARAGASVAKAGAPSVKAGPTPARAGKPGLPAAKGRPAAAAHGRPVAKPGLPAARQGVPARKGAVAHPAASTRKERLRAAAVRRRGPIPTLEAFKGVADDAQAEADQPFKSGFVALVGRPNVGKSTLLNQMVGTKVAIMSDKPQTTRNRILGVVHRTHSQMVFLDTPGIHKPRHRMGEMLNRTAQQTMPDVDVILFLVDGSDVPGEGDRFVADLVQQSGQPAILVVNKMDRVPREKWHQVLDTYKQLGEEWLDVVPISALEGKNVPDLAALIEEQMEEGPEFYPADQVTDRPERFVIAELVREQILHRTFEEIPHSVAVDIEELQERDNGVVYCRATILVERDSQKGILIGEGGQMLKDVGAAARQEAEQLLGSKMFLELWVKVKEDWRNRESLLNQLGLKEE